MQEVKLLHQVFHNNVVRVFNHYLYPKRCLGYILMEFVDGHGFDEYVATHPEQLNELFLQAIAGFAHLERSGILHRDIRSANVMVRTDGTLKIIDLGFGKRIKNAEDFHKSINLNLWCSAPIEFGDSHYDFRTELYFVGKLFEQAMLNNNVGHFKYVSIVVRMCEQNPDKRVQTFLEVESLVKSDQFAEIGLSDYELEVYRQFSDRICQHVTKIEDDSVYATDLDRIKMQLEEAHRGFMLEVTVPDVNKIANCFVLGGQYYRKKAGFPVALAKSFLDLLRSAGDEKGELILANLRTKLDAVPRYSKTSSDDIPF